MPEVRLPSAVRRQAEAADAALRELQGEKIERVETSQYVSDGEPQADTGIDTSGFEASDEAAEESAIPEESGADDVDSSGIDWEAEAKAMKEERDKALAKFNSLRGKYEAEVPRLSDELRKLRAELADLQERSVAAPASSEPIEVDGKSEDELREMYGDEFVSALLATQRRAVEAAKRELAPSLERLNQIEQRAIHDAEEAMFSAISKEHSDWEQVNELATWQKFLAEINPDTGEPRQVAINRAQARNDPAPIIRQLTLFKRRVAKRGNKALETQVVPGSTARTEAPQARDEKVYSAQDIDAFFKRVALSKSRGLPLSDDQKRQESAYTRAMLEGRVA